MQIDKKNPIVYNLSYMVRAEWAADGHNVTVVGEEGNKAGKHYLYDHPEPAFPIGLVKELVAAGRLVLDPEAGSELEISDVAEPITEVKTLVVIDPSVRRLLTDIALQHVVVTRENAPRLWVSPQYTRNIRAGDVPQLFPVNRVPNPRGPGRT